MCINVCLLLYRYIEYICFIYRYLPGVNVAHTLMAKITVPKYLNVLKTLNFVVISSQEPYL